MEALEGVRLAGYFGRVAHQFRASERPAVFLVTHLLADRPAFVRAVGSMSELRSVLPKPKSVDAGARAEVGGEYQVDELSRELFADAERAAGFIAERAPDGPVALLDVGGYFASCLPVLADRLGGRLLGVVEDTENGHRRYTDLGKWPCPVVSVARSPLKEPEDYLVGQSVVFSAEAVMRERGDILQGRAALVIGFGKLGSSIARLPHAKGVAVSLYDTDPVRRIQGEILAALGKLASGRLEFGMQELGTADRAAIAAAWLDYWNR